MYDTLNNLGTARHRLRATSSAFLISVICYTDLLSVTLSSGPTLTAVESCNFVAVSQGSCSERVLPAMPSSNATIHHGDFLRAGAELTRT